MNNNFVLSHVFAVRLVAFWIYWADPAHRQQVIEPWMTPGYVTHSWGVPPDVAAEALGLARGPGGHRPLADIAEERGVSFDALAQELQAAIDTARAAQDQRP